MIEDDLISFLQEGPKIGEQSFRDRFGYCPRGLLRVLTGTVLFKYKVGNKVAYRLIEDVFIQDNELDGLDLDYDDTKKSEEKPKKESEETPKQKGFLNIFFHNKT